MRAHEPAHRLALVAGADGTTRHRLGSLLAAELAARGVAATIAEGAVAGRELAEVEAGAADAALVSGAFEIEGHPRLREVALLQVEALHLLVRREHVGRIGPGLAGLRGRHVDLGLPGSAEAALAAAVLAFAEVPIGGADGALQTNLGGPHIAELVESSDHDALPDAVFHLAAVPAQIVARLVRRGDYELVPLPHADAFRLEAMLAEPRGTGAAEISRAHVVDTVVPAGAYRLSPPSPAAQLQTLGTRLMLVANRSLSEATVERVLETIFESHYARMTHPPLDPSLLGLVPRLPLHAGTTAYLERSHPILTAADVDTLSNSLSLLGALGGATLFAWQGIRQRRQARHARLLEDYLRRVAAHERRVVDLELAASLELEPLVEVQRSLLGLQGEALEHFAEGAFGDRATLAELLLPVNAARDHVADLLLHVRQALEQRAETEGRTADALWNEAVEDAAGEPGAPEGVARRPG